MHLLNVIFGPDLPRQHLALYQVGARALVVYAFGLAAVRIGKGRGIGRITLLDILLGFMLGPLLSPAITGTDSLSAACVGAVGLVFVYWLITFVSYHFPMFGFMVKGQARLVIDHGKFIRENMRHAHFSEHDLLEELRLHGVEDIEQVKHAYVERSGAISVIKR